VKAGFLRNHIVLGIGSDEILSVDARLVKHDIFSERYIDENIIFSVEAELMLNFYGTMAE